MPIPFIAVEISGLADPTYPSAAASRKYVDAAIIGGAGGVVNYSTITAGTAGGITPFEGDAMISGATPITVNVLGYTTISSNAKQAYDWFAASAQGFDGLLDSGTKYTDVYSWYNASANIFDGLKDSGTKYSDTYSWYNASANQFKNWLDSGEKLSRWFSESSSKLSDIAASGIKYSEMYTWYNASAQVFDGLKDSGTKYSDTYSWYNASANQFKNWIDSGEKLSKWYSVSAGAYADLYASGEKFYKAYQSGTKALPEALLTNGIVKRVGAFNYTAVTDNSTQWDNTVASAQIYTTIALSGTKYSQAYASAQHALGDHAFMAKVSSAYLAVTKGWATVADAGTIAHGLGGGTVIPTSHWVVPSGDVSFAISTKIDVTNITVRMSAFGDRDVQWRAEL